MLLFGSDEEIAASKQQIANQLEVLGYSIKKCEDKNEELFQQIDNLKEYEQNTSTYEKEFYNLVEALKQNIKRMKKHSKIAEKILEDSDRIELHIKSRYFVKSELFYHSFMAIIGSIVFATGCHYQSIFGLYGYFFNLCAVLKINFEILEIIGLQNWQRHKLLGSLAMNILESFSGLFYFVKFLMDGRHYVAIFLIAIIPMIVSDFKHRLKQFSDMKKPRPVIPNFKPFPA